MNKVYFDYAASTPVDPRVEAEMLPYFTRKFGNPGSLHSFGQEAIAAVDNSREIIAKAIGADFREIILTGSATEANNLALRGSIRGLTRIVRGSTQMNIRDNQREISENPRPRLIISAIEHESILETARDLEHEGVEVVYVPVNREGIVDFKKLKSALNEKTILVSVMYANNEIGTIQPIAEISKIVKAIRKTRITSELSKRKHSGHSDEFVDSDCYPLFHTDAAQAFQFLDCSVDKLGADLMTISSHKIYGPKGIGALYIRNPISDIRSQITGGGQEFGLRSGTENVPSIVGFAKAVEIASSIKHQESRRITEIRDYFWRGLKKIYPKVEINGAAIRKIRIPSELSEKKYSGHSDAFVDWDRLPNILNIYFPNHSAQDLLAKFDLAGIAVSAGPACKARAIEPSYVIEALGYSRERAENSIRFSLGRPTAKKEINKALKIIRKLL